MSPASQILPVKPGQSSLASKGSPVNALQPYRHVPGPTGGPRLEEGGDVVDEIRLAVHGGELVD